MNITLCGSKKHGNKVYDVLVKHLTLNGHFVFAPAFGPEDGDPLSEVQVDKIHDIHGDKISRSNAVVVVDRTGKAGFYIGDDTARFVDFARKHGVQVYFLSGPDTPTLFDQNEIPTELVKATA